MTYKQVIWRAFQEFNSLFELLLELLRVFQVQRHYANIRMIVQILRFSRKDHNSNIFDGLKSFENLRTNASSASSHYDPLALIRIQMSECAGCGARMCNRCSPHSSRLNSYNSKVLLIVG
jgi:hypothetical protein